MTGDVIEAYYGNLPGTFNSLSTLILLSPCFSVFRKMTSPPQFIRISLLLLFINLMFSREKVRLLHVFNKAKIIHLYCSKKLHQFIDTDWIVVADSAVTVFRLIVSFLAQYCSSVSSSSIVQKICSACDTPAD